MTTDSFFPHQPSVNSDADEQTTVETEWALMQELQAWFLPVYIAATDHLAAEEYQLVQDMFVIANLVLALG